MSKRPTASAPAHFCCPQVFASEHKAKKDKKRLLWVVGIISVVLIIMLAANAGLTYAVVVLSKDTNVDSEGRMISKGNSEQIIRK